MSRLYLQLHEAFAHETLTPSGLRRLLHAFLESHAGLSIARAPALRFEHLLRRPALESDNSGWKRYPVEIDASSRDGHLQLALRFSVVFEHLPGSAACRGS